MIAALYIDPRGPYPAMPDVDCWDAERDARLYNGPYPVVAHPPCGPWSRLSHLCRKQDASCAPRAVEQVRAFGGVLEHPKGSKIFRRLRMPWPGPDAWGGRTYEVQQVAWGHVCTKDTWLYVVGVDPLLVARGIRTGGQPTKVVASSLRVAARELRAATADERIHSPPAFAAWLVSLARSAIKSALSQSAAAPPTRRDGWRGRGQTQRGVKSLMAKKAGVSGSVRRRVFRRDGYRCARCGVAGREERCPKGGFVHPTATDNVYLSIDHIAPRSKGGSHEESNLQTLCTTCNTRKGASL